MECTLIEDLRADIDDKDIGSFDGCTVIITREFGNTRLRSDKPVPQFPEELGHDDHDVYRISCFFGHVGCLWQGMTNVLLHKGTPVWEAVSRALGREQEPDDIGIFDISEDGHEFSVCWKCNLGCR